jgi:hypothetical protein
MNRRWTCYVSKIKKLLDNYETHISIPWRDVAAAQRVIFCVYTETDELRLRAKVDEFEIVTVKRKHKWLHYDLTDTFAKWLVKQKYAKSYFEKPKLLTNLLPRYVDFIDEEFDLFIKEKGADDNTVVAVSGIGTVFGFIKVREFVDRVASKVSGRLLIMFPGSYENNKYSLLDAYDGWNYHAFPITADKEII